MTETTSLLETAAARLRAPDREVSWTDDALTVRQAGVRMTGSIATQRGERALILIVDLCGGHEADPRRVLESAALMGAGALSMVGGRYVVRFTVPAAQIASAPLARIVPYLFAIAAELRSTLRVERQASAAALFAHYTHEEMR
jgi:hypothetical protein